MRESPRTLDDEVLASALRDVVGAAAEEHIREGQVAVAQLVRTLMASPKHARRLVEAVTARAIELRSEGEPPLEFGPVATVNETFDDPPLMFDPMGSPEYDAAIDAIAGRGDRIEQAAGRATRHQARAPCRPE